VLVAVAALVLRWLPRPSAIAAGAPVVAGLLLGLYVTRVGGDYMHARMLLPALLCLLLPVLVVPLTRWTAVPILGLAVWAVTAAGWLRSETVFTREIGANAITDARVFWLDTTLKSHPILAEDAAHVPGYMPDIAAVRAASPGHVLVLKVGSQWLAYPAQATVVSTPGALGFPGMLLPAEVKVTDDLGLANPLASHTESIPGWPMGHDKLLPAAWMIADAGSGTPEELAAATGGAVPATDIAAAREALRRPDIRELVDSVREPLTPGRFLSNFVHAVERTGFRYDRDPQLAQQGR
jgi:arabinofuranosyltransferase